jgi:hypothetical protein
MPLNPDDVAVTLAVRKDLGPQHDEAVIGEFLDRVGAAIDERVDARLAAQRQPGLPADRHRSASNGLAFASLGIGIPISAIALGAGGGGATGIVALLIAWLGIVGVNVAHTRRH